MHAVAITPAFSPVSLRQIELWDWDQFSRNDLIGVTTIDLEDRWFDEKWHSYGKDLVRCDV